MAESRPEEGSDDEDAIADLEERLQVLTAFTSGIVFEIDREARYRRVWAGEPSLLARPASEILGRKVSEVLDGPMGLRFDTAVCEVLATKAQQSFEYSLDVPAGRRTFSCQVCPYRSRSSGEGAVLVLVRDVTEAKELEGKLVQAERLAALGLLAASVGHEIRQPLAYLLASVDALERSVTAPPTGAALESLENVRKGASRIAEIVTTLDVFARQRRRETTTFDVRRSVRAALDLCASELDGRAEVTLELDQPMLVRGDEGEVTQVFANLVLNAAHAIGERGGPAPGRITISAVKSKSEVRVSIADTGTGIAPEDRARIFDPFFTTKEAGRGTGLGLFISRNIVVAHGGALEVDSVPGSGTTVVVQLLSAPPPPPGRTTSDVRPRAIAPRRKLSLLVVDDEKRFVDSVRLVLDGIHDVTAETDPRKGIALIEADPSRFDVVLCDLSMPILDGPMFHARMKELGVADRFVLMPGGAYTTRAAEFLDASACPKINKPFRLEDLLALLEDVARKTSA